MDEENSILRNIIIGSDWQEVLQTIVIEEGMDPLSIDIIHLADTFMNYLQKMERFDFRIPARFILIISILLRMKCELLLEEDEKKVEIKGENPPVLNIENVPLLTPPMIRKPIRKVTLDELVNALNKAFAFKERKEGKKLRMRHAVERLIEPEEDIEVRIQNILNTLIKNNIIKFSDLVPTWKRKDIVNTFIPLLYLIMRNKISCEQEEFFKEIYIRVIM